MQKTKIDWADMTWNPVTGCLHECEYCYAKKIANRFGKFYGSFCLVPHKEKNVGTLGNPLFELNEKRYLHKNNAKPQYLPYPFSFKPTLHRYRLDEPAQITKPQNIFVCSMADLFGEWVPDEWIKAVFEACKAAPQHQYLFLTKNPDRYYQLGDGDENIIPDGGIGGWFGASASTEEQAEAAWENLNCRWISLEPLHGEFSEEFFTYDDRYAQRIMRRWDWIVVGAETGNRKNKVIPKKEWVDEIINQCRSVGTPVFLKSSLLEVMEGELIQEYPWEV
jgi:protein gp37